VARQTPLRRACLVARCYLRPGGRGERQRILKPLARAKFL
jgi:hypothetical protein